MAVSDAMVIVLVICTLVYLMLWRMGDVRRAIADILLIVIGVASHYIVSVTQYPWGFVIAAIAIIDLLWVMFVPEGK